MNAPFTVVGNTGPELNALDLTGCTVTAVETSLTISAPDMAASTGVSGFDINLVLPGQVITGTLVYHAALTGTTMGTTCTDLLFKDGGASFSTATSPYVGTFKPYGDFTVPGGTGSFAQYIGKQAGAKWGLLFQNLAGPMQVDCWTLKITVQ